MAAPARVEHGPRVGGLVPFSATDYPGRLAAVVFLRGCAWRCGYCQNPHLLAPEAGGEDWPRVLAFLERRRGLVEAVVFSGGEPTSDPALEEAVAQVRALGFAIGLHSAGVHPRRLARILPQCDWVGLDVKAPFDRYERVTGVAGSGARARESLEAVLATGCDYEVRTTWHPALLEEDDVHALAHTLAAQGVRRFALQAFRVEGCSDAVLRSAGGPRPSPALLAELASLFADFTWRPSA
ncbi:anaerobic ribonucleoside-triphosphate reductase activating protein [Betaproteobacteria bacterium GR16-43]|nr:anaerobic ribonucleoside-triphosphate reductase activating protein [Betaproteobacteria bacterium GR16-43]